ncbi:MAG: hypothetical protein NTU98_06495 [Bacteroidetes bacterium]|nr:hypothetical protein [Bacteroidota bacterium]
MKADQTVVPMEPGNPGPRLYTGLGVLVLSFFMLPTGIFLQQYVHTHLLKNLIIGIFWISAPAMKITSVAILGKPTYLWIKAKFMHHYHRVIKPYHESRLRYNIGLILFCAPAVPTYIMAYAPQMVSDNFYLRLILNISVDVIFITSLFVLGGDFWDKLKALFVFSAKVKFPEEESEK